MTKKEAELYYTGKEYQSLSGIWKITKYDGYARDAESHI